MFLLFLVFMDDSHTVFFYLLDTTALKTISLPAHIMCHGNNYQEQKVHVAQMIKMKHYWWLFTFNLCQFNSKTLFRDDDQVGLKYIVLEKLTGTNSHLTH